MRSPLSCKKSAKDLKNTAMFFKSFAGFFNLSANFPEDISLLLFLESFLMCLFYKIG